MKLCAQENCRYETIRGSCFGKTEVELFMRLPRNVYKLEEIIPVHVECTTKGSSVVKEVIVLLVQEAIYTCHLGTKEEVRKKERLVMSEATGHRRH